jgi:hypothetical protein
MGRLVHWVIEYRDRKIQSVTKVVGGTGEVTGKAGGNNHSLVTTREVRGLGFGDNRSGQLGLGAEAEVNCADTGDDRWYLRYWSWRRCRGQGAQGVNM